MYSDTVLRRDHSEMVSEKFFQESWIPTSLRLTASRFAPGLPASPLRELRRTGRRTGRRRARHSRRRRRGRRFDQTSAA